MKMPSVAAFMQYYDNIGGSVPAWLINWAAKVSVSVLELLLL